MIERLALGILLVLVTAGCGARPSTPASHPPKSAPSSPSSSSGAPPGLRADVVPSLDVLATRHAREMPLMREAVRVNDAAMKPTDLEAKTMDTCFRAAVAANAPVRAWFEDAQHSERGEVMTLASSTSTGSDALVPPRGPACARKGETLKLMVVPASGAAPIVARAIVWQSP